MRYIGVFFLFLSINALSSVDYVKVDKSDREMHLLSGDKILKSYRIALGGNPKGHKEEEGDQRTPEGVYVLDYVKEDSSFHRAMHVSYPNVNDEKMARHAGVSPGGFIMVHGQKNGFGWLALVAQRFDWTDGCIALTNSEMDEFISLVPVGTPIEIQW